MGQPSSDEDVLPIREFRDSKDWDKNLRSNFNKFFKTCLEPEMASDEFLQQLQSEKAIPAPFEFERFDNGDAKIMKTENGRNLTHARRQEMIRAFFNDHYSVYFAPHYS